MPLPLALAWRSLRRHPSRAAAPLLVAAGGTLVVLMVSGFYLGLLAATVAWIRTLPGDAVVTPADGNPALMQAYADLPPATVQAVARMDGVGAVHELVGQRAWLSHDDRDAWVQLVGIRPHGAFGAPLRILAGRPRPRLGEIVIDAVVADDLHVRLGDRIGVRSAAVRSGTLLVAGIAAGGNNVIGSYAFVSRATLALAGLHQPTHLFVEAAPGRDPSAVRAALAALPGVRVLTRDAFEERNLTFPRQVFGAVVGTIDAVVALVVVAMIAVVLHAGSLERRTEYGLLAALGIPGRVRYGHVVAGTLLATLLGVVVGSGLALGLARLLPVLLPRFVSAMPPWLLAAVGVAALGVGLVAALRPVRDVATTDPALVLRV